MLRMVLGFWIMDYELKIKIKRCCVNGTLALKNYYLSTFSFLWLYKWDSGLWVTHIMISLGTSTFLI